MTRTNIAIVLIVTAALLAIATAQTRTQQGQGQVGRYQLLSAQYKWLATDSERKLVVDDRKQLFRIDTVTGETAVLAFRADENSQMHSFWVAVGK
jgi:opacity protein-like surface antigen